MLGQRRRRWTNIQLALVQRFVFAGHVRQRRNVQRGTTKL